MKIGIFGGTFNPIHFGHLRTVEEIREHFNIDLIYFVLAKLPPHKQNKNLVSAQERYILLKKAIKNNPFFKASSVELRRKKASYSYDTIKYFKKKYYGNEISFIMGSDAFFEINTWYNYKKILENIDIIVMLRPNIYLDKNFIKNLGYTQKENYWINNFRKKIYFFQVTELNISSSKIRKLLANKQSVKYFLPEICMKYILKKNLYIRKEENGK